MGRLSGAPAADDFRHVIGHFASGVTIVTTELDGRPFGTTASAVASLSLTPPMVVVCLNRSSETGQAIHRSRAFGVNILSEDQAPLAERFATKGGDRWADVARTPGVHGQPLLDDALAQLECRVTEAVDGGTHTLFLAAVDDARALGGTPLAYFRGRFGRLETTDDEALYDALRERVLGRLMPEGQTLELLALAEHLDTTHGALFHALGRLSREGLIERTETGAFVVPPVRWAAVEDALDACAAIEVGAAQLAAPRVTDDELAALRLAMEASLEHVVEGRLIDVDRSLHANEAFHECLVGLAGSDALVRAYRRLALPGLVARTFRPHVCSAADAEFGRDHRDVVDAFAARDPAAASAVLGRHYARTKDSFRAELSAAA